MYNLTNANASEEGEQTKQRSEETDIEKNSTNITDY